MNKVIESLFALQTLELESPKKRSQALTLREQIPSEILNRFDKFLARGKKGVALVQNGICKGCQIQIPIGLVNSLILGASPSTCGNCGRYLCLPDPAESQSVVSEAATKPASKPASKPRKRKPLAATTT